MTNCAAEHIRELDIQIVSDNDTGASESMQASMLGGLVEKPLPPRDSSSEDYTARPNSVPPNLDFPAEVYDAAATFDGVIADVSSEADTASIDVFEGLSLSPNQPKDVGDVGVVQTSLSDRSPSPAVTERHDNQKALQQNVAKRGIGSAGSFVNIVAKPFKRRSERQGRK